MVTYERFLMVSTLVVIFLYNFKNKSSAFTRKHLLLNAFLLVLNDFKTFSGITNKFATSLEDWYEWEQNFTFLSKTLVYNMNKFSLFEIVKRKIISGSCFK